MDSGIYTTPFFIFRNALTLAVAPRPQPKLRSLPPPAVTSRLREMARMS